MGMLDPAVAIPVWSSRCLDFAMIRPRPSRDTEYDGLHSIPYSDHGILVHSVLDWHNSMHAYSEIEPTLNWKKIL